MNGYALYELIQNKIDVNQKFIRVTHGYKEIYPTD